MQHDDTAAKVHDRTNCWYTGKQWIPVENMTEDHLLGAKLFAQRQEEYHYRRSAEWANKADMLEQEAERRGIHLRDYRSQYRENVNVLKKTTLTDK